MHFLEKHGLLVLRVPSKFDLRRVCRATGAVALVKLATPSPDELGFVKQARRLLLLLLYVPVCVIRGEERGRACHVCV